MGRFGASERRRSFHQEMIAKSRPGSKLRDKFEEELVTKSLAVLAHFAEDQDCFYRIDQPRSSVLWP